MDLVTLSHHLNNHLRPNSAPFTLRALTLVQSFIPWKFEAFLMCFEVLEKGEEWIKKKKKRRSAIFEQSQSFPWGKTRFPPLFSCLLFLITPLKPFWSISKLMYACGLVISWVTSRSRWDRAPGAWIYCLYGPILHVHPRSTLFGAFWALKPSLVSIYT